MQVTLAYSLLTAPEREILSILALCAFGLMGKHRVIPDDRAVWNTWAEELPPDLADEVKAAWDQSEASDTLGVAALPLHVRQTSESDLQGHPIIASPEVALALLSRPLRLLLENGRNDRGFLLAFCDPAIKQTLLHAEDEGWLVFESAGGIGELKVRLEAAAQGLNGLASHAEAVRTLYLCDSDAREPGTKSDDAQEIQKSLDSLHYQFRRQLRPPGERPKLLGYILTRRAAENYAPVGDVLRWAMQRYGPDGHSLIRQAETEHGRQALQIATGANGTDRRRLVAAIALRELAESTRSVLCMKKGRGQDPPWRTADNIWRTLAPFQAAALNDGFGANFSATFYAQAHSLRDETGEVIAFLSNLLERL